MLMKYFEYILFIGVIGLFFLPVLYYRWHWRLKYLKKMALLSVLFQQQNLKNRAFYSSYIIKQCVTALYFRTDKKSRRALACLVCGKVEPAAEILQAEKPYLALLLIAHQNASAAYRQINHQKKLFLHSEYAVFLPLLAHHLFEFSAFRHLLLQINRPKIPLTLRPYYDYAAAYVYLQEADMLSASQSADKALKAFSRKQYFYEEAQCYLQTAEIYRLSCVNDIAQTMLESALKIFSKLKSAFWIAHTIAVKGMLMLYENRLEEAEECYIEALNLAPNSTIKADILNQYALLQIVQNKLSAARRKILTAAETYKQQKNQIGKAFSEQLLGQIALHRKQYASAAKHSLTAAELYEKQKNYAATAESLYTAATACFKQQKFRPAEAYLRQILQINRNHQNSFHSANAYSLLGLIYLQTGDIQRAKVLFQQSLHLEQRFERCEGLVADYADLALIEKLSGDEDSARHNLQIALEYAQKTENSELIDLINQKIAHLN